MENLEFFRNSTFDLIHSNTYSSRGGADCGEGAVELMVSGQSAHVFPKEKLARRFGELWGGLRKISRRVDG